MTTPTITSGRPTADTLSLGRGAAGTALLRIEQALNGGCSWREADASIRVIASLTVDGSSRASLFLGAPALAFVLHCARADGRPRYKSAASALNEQVHRIVWQRLAVADARIRRGEPAAFTEYDLFYGLAGLGALLLRMSPDSDTVPGILGYLIALTRERQINGTTVPGWWTAHDPDPSLPTPGGHANLGMAHGAAGLLAVLSLAALNDITVPGQQEAIGYLCTWFDRWQQDSPDGIWWPQWLTLDNLRESQPGQPGPGRPSWCYGAAGIARALQLAAIATGDTIRQAAAEHALAACLSGPQLARLDSPGLCHGMAGLHQTALRAARDTLTPEIGSALPALAAELARQCDDAAQPGLLTGCAGLLLVQEAVRHHAPLSGWDACLLIT